MKKLIGITGFARSGKDTFFNRAKTLLEKDSYRCERVAFADALKSEVNQILEPNAGISAFTEDNLDKELIRPLLVTYGTDIRRKLNPNCWIEKIQPQVIDLLEDNKFVFVTDVRYANEAEWIKINQGILIKVERHGILPANHEEHKQSVLLKKFVDFNLGWPTYGEDLSDCDSHIIPILARIVQHVKNYEHAYQEVM
jgi:hypothetical protein